MNWQAVGALAEGIGAIAVLATLLYLARQIQQTGRYARANAQQVLVDEFNRYFKELTDDDAMRRRFCQTMTSWDQLPNDDQAAGFISISRASSTISNSPTTCTKRSLSPTPSLMPFDGSHSDFC